MSTRRTAGRHAVGLGCDATEIRTAGAPCPVEAPLQPRGASEPRCIPRASRGPRRQEPPALGHGVRHLELDGAVQSAVYCRRLRVARANRPPKAAGRLLASDTPSATRVRVSGATVCVHGRSTGASMPMMPILRVAPTLKATTGVGPIKNRHNSGQMATIVCRPMVCNPPPSELCRLTCAAPWVAGCGSCGASSGYHKKNWRLVQVYTGTTSVV